MNQQTIDFDGKTYDRSKDHKRLHSQLDRVKIVLSEGAWMTLAEIKEGCLAIQSAFDLPMTDSESGISARLRDLRKEKFGGAPHHVESRRRADSGTWEYRWVKKS